jgi:prepilin-type N-terminal cleavage/methylation domain-containing protein
MACKTPFKLSFKNIADNQGFTILELLVVIAVMALLSAALVLMLRPSEMLQKGRDNRRVSDLSKLDRLISEYKVDKGIFPDSEDTLRASNVLPAGSTDLTKVNTGWILANLSSYTTTLPIDPLNDATYNYKYAHNGDTYELNATLEVSTADSQNDGGNQAGVYELGDNLTLIP